MPPTEHSPLLAANNELEDRIDAPEDSPLLADHEDSQPEPEQQDGQERRSSSSAQWPRSKSADGSKKSKWRWPSIAAGAILVLLVIAVLVGGFVMPGAVKEYAEGAAVIEPTGLSVESITSDGVRARIQANFRMDGSRVDNVNSRRLGRFATGIMRKLETSETNVNVYLPHYDNSLLGSAVVPPITVDLRDGHTTTVDFVTDLTPGDAEHIKKIANNWLEGKLDQLKVTGAAKIQVKSGIFPLGAHDVVESMVFEASKIPSVPEYNIERLTFMDVPMGRDGRMAVGANVSLALHNDYHVGLNVPPLGFEILLANCDSSDPYITVAEAVTDNIVVRPLADVHAGALGIIREIPKSLVRSCPKSNMSPLDHFMGRYLRGEDAEIYVRGNKIEDSNTPEWVTSILRSIMVPIEFPGHSFGNVIRNFSATDVNFQMGSPFADPNDPEGVPHVSGTIQVIAALPEEFDLDLGVQNLRSDAELFYKGKKLGNLNMEDWNPAHSTRVTIDNEVMMNITSRVLNVPLDVTNNDVFTDILQKMFFGDGDILLTVEANVDVQVGTVLGHVDLKGIPANGTIPVKSSSSFW